MKCQSGDVKTVIRGASVWHNGIFEPKDVLVEGGRIAAIADFVEADSGTVVAHADGKYLLPGLVDVHVHMRQPGFDYKETVECATKAAARGGFTTVCAMPNLNPAPDSIEHLAEEEAIIARDARIRVLPYATITTGRRGERTVDYAALKPRVAGFSDDGCGVQSEEVMERAMRGIAAAGGILAAHCEVEKLAAGGHVNECGYAAAHNLKGIPAESEWREVERDITLAAKTGCRLHICHISTARSAELVREAKAKGIEVTCETAPHYLVLCDEDLRDEGRFKMNPPLRSREDMEALRSALADGTIDMIATDHAPHAAEEKSSGLAGSAMGVVGLETALPVIYTNMVGGGVITLGRMVELMSDAPRKVFGLGGGIAVGEKADLTVVDFQSEFNIDSADFASKGRSTPFDGMRVRGEVLLTMVDGKTVYRRERLIL